MKKIKKAICAMLSIVLLSAMCIPFAATAADSYTIVSPYEDVVWSGSNAWGAYKGNLHTHSTISDGDDSYPEIIKEFYNQGFDFLAMSDHGVTGVEWNKKQTFLPLYTYQLLMGNNFDVLTDEEYNGITSGSYPTYDGEARGSGMVCVTGANELNNLTLTKSHVNGYFLEAGVGDGYDGGENGYEAAVKFVDKNGGLSHINHPGDWIESNANPDNINDPENIAFFSDIFLKYDSCLGTEVFNEDNGTTGYDRILWDNLLMSVLPYGRNVIGFSNGDTHDFNHVDSSFSIFMMEENNVENIKAAMQQGNFFMVTRHLRSNSTIGPATEIDAMNTDLPYPVFTKVEVDGHTVSVEAEDAETIQWIANGTVIASQAVTDDVMTLDLDEIDGAEDFQYVRAELIGEGGMCLTQALIIDDGSEPLTYEEDTSLSAKLEDVLFFLKSTRFWVIIVELYRAIKN